MAWVELVTRGLDAVGRVLVCCVGDGEGAFWDAQHTAVASELERVLILGLCDGTPFFSGTERNWDVWLTLRVRFDTGRSSTSSFSALVDPRSDPDRLLPGLGMESDCFPLASSDSSSESEERDKTLFIWRSISVTLRSVCLEAREVLVWRDEMLVPQSGDSDGRLAVLSSDLGGDPGLFRGMDTGDTGRRRGAAVGAWCGKC